jgi:hypothetical protein
MKQELELELGHQQASAAVEVNQVCVWFRLLLSKLADIDVLGIYVSSYRANLTCLQVM